MEPLRAGELFACLDRHGVRYVLIGGLAAVLHGSPLPTLDADICVAFMPAGSTGFDDLARHATPMTIWGVTIAVAALEGVIRTKAAADRPKDRRSLPLLQRLLEEIQKRRDTNEN